MLVAYKFGSCDARAPKFTPLIRISRRLLNLTYLICQFGQNGGTVNTDETLSLPWPLALSWAIIATTGEE